MDQGHSERASRHTLHLHGLRPLPAARRRQDVLFPHAVTLLRASARGRGRTRCAEHRMRAQAIGFSAPATGDCEIPVEGDLESYATSSLHMSASAPLESLTASAIQFLKRYP